MEFLDGDSVFAIFYCEKFYCFPEVYPGLT